MRRFVILSTLLLVGLAAVYSAPQSKQRAAAKGGSSASAAYGNADSITEDELKAYLYFIASDQLEGRNLPSRGFDTAALYVASHLAEWGLKPGGSTDKTDGPLQRYFMPMELVAKTVNTEESKASVTGRAGGRGGRGNGGGAGAGGGGARGAAAGPATLEYGRDWTVASGGRGAPPLEPIDVTAPMVFAGNGYLIKKTNTNPYQGIDVKGKIIVVAGVPAEIAAQQAAAAPGRGADQPNPLGEPCKDFMTPAQYGAANGALAVVSVANFAQLTAMSNPNAVFGGFGGGRGGLNGPNYQVPKLVAAPACPSVPVVTAGLGMTNAIFAFEKAGAQQVFYAAGNNTKQDSFELNAEKKMTLKVALKTETNHAENVIGIVEGGDPVLKNEFVVISAHLDHIGLSQPLPDGHNVNNGADDDGSGTVGLMAMAKAYAEGAAKGMRPKRSMIFLWNAGEEKGLWGSQYFAEYPPFDITKVVADLNIDMIGRTKGEGFKDPDSTHAIVKPGEIFVIGPNISSDELEKAIETVNDGYLKLQLNHFYDTTAPDATHDNLGPQPRGQRIFYRSDHYNFAKVGIPIAFFTTGLHPDYHRPTDTPDKIDYKEIQTVSKTVAAVAWSIANAPGRPQLKSTLPEQLIKDMKSAKEQGWGKTTPVLAPLPGMPK